MRKRSEEEERARIEREEREGLAENVRRMLEGETPSARIWDSRTVLSPFRKLSINSRLALSS